MPKMSVKKKPAAAYKPPQPTWHDAELAYKAQATNQGVQTGPSGKTMTVNPRVQLDVTQIEDRRKAPKRVYTETQKKMVEFQKSPLAFVKVHGPIGSPGRPALRARVDKRTVGPVKPRRTYEK